MESLHGHGLQGRPAQSAGDEYDVGHPQAVPTAPGCLPIRRDEFIRAGGQYATPWTRDASINSWNAASLLAPAVARNTLWAVCERQANGRLIIQRDNQWWDKVIWAQGAWTHFLVTGDREFLAHAYEAVSESLAEMCRDHFNERFGLFEGPSRVVRWHRRVSGAALRPEDFEQLHSRPSRWRQADVPEHELRRLPGASVRGVDGRATGPTGRRGHTLHQSRRPAARSHSPALLDARQVHLRLLHPRHRAEAAQPTNRRRAWAWPTRSCSSWRMPRR